MKDIPELRVRVSDNKFYTSLERIQKHYSTTTRSQTIRRLVKDFDNFLIMKEEIVPSLRKAESRIKIALDFIDHNPSFIFQPKVIEPDKKDSK